MKALLRLYLEVIDMTGANLVQLGFWDIGGAVQNSMRLMYGSVN